MNTIERFKNCYGHGTAFIIGSGYSLKWFRKLKFAGSFTIGVNRIAKWFPCDFVIVHHHDCIPEIQQNRNFQALFVSRYDCCVIRDDEPDHSRENYFVYDHLGQGYHKNDFRPLFPDFQAEHPNHILTGGNTVINAIGLAYYMGAKNIILVGCDGGAINGKSNIPGYHPDTPASINHQTGHSIRSLALNMEIRSKLWEYGVNLMTLSPFLDLNLEENRFQPFHRVPGEEYYYKLYEKYRLI